MDSIYIIEKVIVTGKRYTYEHRKLDDLHSKYCDAAVL